MDRAEPGEPPINVFPVGLADPGQPADVKSVSAFWTSGWTPGESLDRLDALVWARLGGATARLIQH